MSERHLSETMKCSTYMVAYSSSCSNTQMEQKIAKETSQYTNIP